jgi:hypothetical protein
VHGRDEVEREAEEVHAAPHRIRDPVAGQRRCFDRDEQVETDDPERDRHGVPRGSEGDEYFGEPEMHVAVAHDRDDVDHREHEGQAAEEAVQVEEPGPPHNAFEGAGRHREAPEDRSGEQGPGHDTGGTGDIPGELCAHGIRG